MSRQPAHTTTALDPATQVRVRLRVQSGLDIQLGPGRIDVLQGVAETGSIAEAGRRLGMSYQRAWSLVQAMNAAFTEPLVFKQRGGSAGGGAALTATGERVLAAYRAAEAAALAATQPYIGEVVSLLRQR